MDQAARPIMEEYISYIEEYGFSILGGEVPILGKRAHRKRINEPEFLLRFLEFLDTVFQDFKHVIVGHPGRWGQSCVVPDECGRSGFVRV